MDLRPALPGLDVAVIDQLAGAWDDRGLWEDIEHLASRFRLADEGSRSIAWHHLVMAVGNFKRPRGRRLHPALGVDATDNRQPVLGAISVPGTDPAVVVEASEPGTWETLSTKLPGSAVATTTTLLAALWPEAHFVFDWRVRAAATALRIDADADHGGVDPDSTSSWPLTFADYRRARAWGARYRHAQGRRVTEVERALYCLSQTVKSSPTARTWRSYAKEVTAALARIRAS